MSSNSVNSTKEKTKIYETILSSPGMAGKCKISMMISRQNILLLSRLIEVGLVQGKNNFDDDIISVLTKESVEELKEIHGEILRRADRLEFYEKLKSI